MPPVANKLYSVLLAEDDPDDQKIVADALAAAMPQARLTIVKNGKEAVQYLQNADSLPDVFITDIQMPIMTGFEAIAHHLSSFDASEVRLRQDGIVVEQVNNAPFRCL